MPSSNLILCCPLLLLPPIPPSIRVFSNESTLLRMRWPKYWSFTFSSIPSKEIPGLISFRMDWLDLPAVQGPLKSLLQHHSSEFFSAQPSLSSSSYIHTRILYACEMVKSFLNHPQTRNTHIKKKLQSLPLEMHSPNSLSLLYAFPQASSTFQKSCVFC